VTRFWAGGSATRRIDHSIQYTSKQPKRRTGGGTGQPQEGLEGKAVEAVAVVTVAVAGRAGARAVAVRARVFGWWRTA
jgi:hypothetical protein